MIIKPIGGGIISEVNAGLWKRPLKVIMGKLSLGLSCGLKDQSKTIFVKKNIFYEVYYGFNLNYINIKLIGSHVGC